MSDVQFNCCLTHLPRNNMADTLADDILKNIFFNENDSYRTEIYSQESNWQ